MNFSLNAEKINDTYAEINLKKHFDGTYERIRTVRVGPDGYLYITTSNRDGRGSPITADDRIIRVDPKTLIPGANVRRCCRAPCHRDLPPHRIAPVPPQAAR